MRAVIISTTQNNDLPPTTYLILLCSDAGCRFRFPAPVVHPTKCPQCGAPVVVSAEINAAEISSEHTHAGGVPFVGLLDNIRSVYNVGSLFRTADAIGLQHLYLCGITATPAHPRLAKTALGAEKMVNWSSHPNALECIDGLRQSGYNIYALETVVDATPLDMMTADDLSTPLALVVGNEQAGVDPAILHLCDRVIAIPMRGHKLSLNVATAFGIAAFHLAHLHA